MTRARTVAEVIAGEAVSGTYAQRMADMRAIASVVANRAQMLGIPAQDVVANQNEFNAYGRSLPPGVNQAIIDMAQEAIDDVAANGPVNNATFYATPAATGNLPNGLSYEDETAGHQFFSDPQNRAIGTAKGYVTPNAFAYAANPANVPTPSSATNGLLSGWSDMAAADPIEVEPGHPGWGLNRNVAPALTPTVESWSAMTAAQPIEAPTQGLLSAAPSDSFSDLAAAGPFGGLYAAPEDRFGPAPAAGLLSQTDIDRAFFSPTTAAIDPSFTEGLMSANNPVVPSAVQTQSFTPSTAVASQPADLGSMPDAYAAQRGPTSGILSAEHQMVQIGADNALKQAQADIEAGTFPGSAKTAFVEEPAQAPAVAAIAQQTTPSMTPSQIAGYQQMAQLGPAGGLLNLSGQSIVSPTGDLAAPAEIQAPALETVEVKEQPTITGPATTPAVEQQVTANTNVQAPVEAQQAQQPASLGQRLSKAINPGTIGGGLLGSLALGPMGGLVGGLLGNAAYGGGLLGSSQPMSINNIGGGLANTASIWGGGMAPGTQATASDGQTITAMPGGNVAVTGKSGIVTVFDPSGKAMAYGGGLLGGNEDAETEGGRTSGGFFGGLFG